MDDQTNNPGGIPPSDPTTSAPSEPVTPPAEPVVPSAEPVAPVATPATEEKCVTCGGPASAGTCSACAQGEISCSCQPAGGSTPVV